MRFTIAALITAPLALGATPSLGIEVTDCKTGDSALCLAEPNCYWDVNRRGCYEGQAAKADACAAHSSQSICEADVTLGCQWTDENCVSKSD